MKPFRLLAVLEASTITGPAKNLLDFARVARAGGFEPPVETHIAVFQRAGASTLFLETARRMEIPVHEMPEHGRFDRRVAPMLQALARELAPDIIQTHAVKSHFLLRRSGIYRATPWIAFHHGYTWTDPRMRLYNQLDRWSLRASERIVTVCGAFRDELVRAGVTAGKIEIVHNAIDAKWGRRFRTPEARAVERGRLGIAPEKRVALIVGRLSREKDHLALIEAVHMLRRDGRVPEAHLLIVGEGPERARIEALVARLGMAEAVTLAGQAPSAEPYYGAADVAVLSSRTEGSPNALLEAMAAGVPVVATAVGGVPELVRDGESALLVEPGDPQAMAQAITAVLGEPDLAAALAAAAHQRILDHHAPEARVRRLIGIYQSCRLHWKP